jgi:hypothetical protein
MPFTIAADLQGRVEERIRIFEFPICDTDEMKIMFKNGLLVPVVKQDCIDARNEDRKFTDYIFAKYISASDIVMDPEKITGSYDKDYFRKVSRNGPAVEKTQEELSRSFQSKVDLLVTKIENFESMYRKDLTKIMGNLDSLNVKMDYIYRKIFEDEEGEKKEK